MSSLFARGAAMNARQSKAVSNPETVSLIKRTGGDGFSTYPGIPAVRRVLSKDERISYMNDPRLISNGIVFLIFAADLPSGVTLTVRDGITGADGLEYLIESGSLIAWDDRWRYVCTKAL